MILVDTGVWSHHFRENSPRLVELLRGRRVVVHPWVLGELALGPGLRLDVLDDLRRLPRVEAIGDEALLDFVVLHGLRGVGWVDAQLLAAALAAKTPIWTTDAHLSAVAGRFEVLDEPD